MRADPELVGPRGLCMVFGSVLGSFSAGGNPESDVYTWVVTNPAGETIFTRSGGIQYETIEVWFTAPGEYRVQLSVRRNVDIILTTSMPVQVAQGPELVVLPDYLLCGDKPTDITAINPNSPNFDKYVIKWTDVHNNVVGTTNTISVSQPGHYFYELYLGTSGGAQVCLITGSTYAGPSLDFSIELDKASVCQGQWLSASTNSSSPGEWFLVNPNSTTKTSLGTDYEISVGGSQLPDIGTYTLVFSAFDPNYPDCASERQTTFEVTEGPALKVNLVQSPDDCTVSNGSIEIVALSPLDSLFVNEVGFSATNVERNQSVIVSGLEPRVLTVVAYAHGCEIVHLFTLEHKVPPISAPSIQITPEVCSDTGVSKGLAQVTFTQGAATGKYRLMGVTRGSFERGDFQNEDQLSFSLAGGSYLLELEIGGCIYPVQELNIPNSSTVEFKKPTRVIICESFELTPETSQDLNFTLTYPDQTKQTIRSGEAFTLTQVGDYELLGESTSPSSGLCPKVEKFTATASSPFSFEVKVHEEDCFGNQIYQAVIEGFAPSETSIRWRNDKNEIVGRGEIFYIPSAGNFSLLVQPLENVTCPIEPIYFSVEAPIFYAEVVLEATKICPDPGTALVKMTTDTTIVSSIEWIYFDDAGNRKDLPEFAGQKELTVNIAGNYEAVIYNRIGCEMGRNFIRVDNSTLLDLPKIEESYGICSRGSTSTTIDPGEFAEYFWYYEGELVSTEPKYSPKEIGNFSLEVVTADSCRFSAEFQTYDACNFQYAYPNAMVLGDPEKIFEVTVSKGITGAELFILNRQGSLVHYQKTEETPVNEAFFQWDGTANGKYIIPGTYVVILVGRNPEFQFEEKITGSLLVIE